MKTHTIKMFVISAMLSAIPAYATAASLIFTNTQTLEGWNERVFSTTWIDLEPDVKNFVSTDIGGDLRGFNHPTTTVWLQSPEFVLGVGEISIREIYLVGGADAAPAGDSGVSGTMSASGWGGIALRDTDGNFVLTYSDTTIWEPVVFTAEQLSAFVGQTLTLNFINTNNSVPEFLYVNRPISIEGTLVAIPEASTAALGSAALSILLLRRRRTGAA